MAENIQKQELTKQYATTYGAILQDIGQIYNLTGFDYDTIAQMLKDETIMAGLEFFSSNVLNYIGDYNNDDENIKQFVEDNLENLDISLGIILDRMIRDMKAYGFAVSEMVWELKKGKLVLKKLLPLPPGLLSMRLENGEVVGIIEQTTHRMIEIPAEKCFIFRNDNSQLFGRSDFERLYRAWKFKSVMFKFWAIAMERYAAPVLVGHTDGDTEDVATKLASLWSNGVVAIGNDEKIDLLEPSRNVASTFENAIEYANMLLYRGLLLPQLLAGSKDVGSYALGKVHFDLFMTAVKKTARKIAEEMIDQVVSKILDYNFSGVRDYGDFLMSEQPSSDEREKLANVVLQLVNAGFLDPTEDNEWVRSMLSFPNPEPQEQQAVQQDEEEIWRVSGRSLKHTIEQKIE